ncbi:MAG TPA: aminomethyl-transferring glycine dehydrogenase subunit GcvPA [Candidatus Kapabacteria bacterium]|nr:aminomethyl-transferring glycine dehydrogenase subunit GcvPA [Candidatus Kapabacteria bacterium]
MTFVPNTDQERQQMLNTIGVNSFDEIISNIPEKFKLKEPLNLPPSLSEMEAFNFLQNLSNKNITSATNSCYLGGGAYDHYIPSIVDSVLQKPEFKTAYTPYQAEVSQGTLQAMYEYQTMICELTGMPVSNASLYDGGGALAESCLMSNAHNNKKKFLVAGQINPSYLQVTKTLTYGRNLEYIEVVDADGTCDLTKLQSLADDTVSGIIVQQPNFLGNLEDVREIEKIAHSIKSLFIVVVNPISLGLLEAPGTYNADVVVGEGQVLGIPMNFGGPYLGVFACKQEFVRKIPGRLSGVTQDLDGKRAFVLTLQTREQQIKRDKATSNICTNQGLFMLAATVYMATMGKQGIKEVAEQSFHKAHYLASKISEIPGFELDNNKPFFNEFLVKTPVDAKVIVDKGADNNILPGLNISRFLDNKSGLLIAVTEKRSKEELDLFIQFLKNFSK